MVTALLIDKDPTGKDAELEEIRLITARDIYTERQTLTLTERHR